MNEQNANQQTQLTRKEIEVKVIAEAWKDESYKQKLLSNPREVIEREFNVKLSSDVNVTVMEEDSSNLYFVLPMRPSLSDAALSDEQLEAIAGGVIPLVVGAVAAGTAATFGLGAVDGYLENK